MVDETLGRELEAGDQHYRAFVGPPKLYDEVAAMQFNLLTALGLREDHYLADIGCGSLRAGRLFIPYLLPGRYFGVEPERWLVEEGIARELGADVVRVKRPTFRYADDFGLAQFGVEFDFLVAQSVFSHAAQDGIRRCLGEAAAVMHEGSVFAATFMRGAEDYEGGGWVYPGCVSYRLRTIAALAGEHGLRCRRLRWPHPNDQTWVAFTKGARARPAFGPRRRLVAEVRRHGRRMAERAANRLYRALRER
jgi:SAM-dependent methyltransferase